MQLHFSAITIGLAAVATAAPAAWADTIWTAGSVHTLIADFVLADKLIVQEGVTVKLSAGVQFIIASGGELVVEGTPDSLVLFTSNGSDRWGGIAFESGSMGSVANAIVEHCDPVGIAITSASPIIDRCVIQDIASSVASVPAAGISISGLLPNSAPARPLIAHTSISAVVGATGPQPNPAGAGPNGPNGSNGTTLSPDGEAGTAGSTGGAGTNAQVGGDAFGVLIQGGAGGAIVLSDIREITAGVGGTGGTGGKGGKGGHGGNGVAGVFTGSGGNGANGGKGGKGGNGGLGGASAGVRLISPTADALALDGLLIESIDGGAGGLGGTGGEGGQAGAGGDGANCSIPGCNAGDGGNGGKGGTSGAAGQNGPGGVGYAIFADGTTASLGHSTIVGLIAGAGGPPQLCPTSNCCTTHPGAGCDDATCMAAVCGIDSFCCQVEWDGICGAEAGQLCGTLCEGTVVCGVLTGQAGFPGVGGAGGAGGIAVFPAQDGSDGTGGALGATGASGSLGADGTSAGIVATNSTISLVSSILEMQASDATSTAFETGGAASISVHVSCVHGYQTISSGVVAFDNVILSDPGFAPSDAGTYELSANSPCIDAGTDVVVEMRRSASAWTSLVSGPTASAFDEFFPGIPNGTDCLAQTPATLPLRSVAVTVSAFSSDGSPLCAVSDGSTPPAVADAPLSGPLGARVDFEFDPPVVAFYTFYGSMATGGKARMTLFEGGVEIAHSDSAASPSMVSASGHGFLSSRPIDRVSITSLADTAMTVGAFVGLAGGEPSLGTVNIPGYAGPSGSAVQRDFGLGFDDAVMFDVVGALRIIDGDGDGIARADMGAYEFQRPTAPPCPADLDGDGTVNAADLATLLGSWGPCPSCAADLDASGSVDASDLAVLLGAWGPCP